jgi:hypothetical protein
LNGICSASCGGSLSNCLGSCVDKSKDTLNCGFCGHVCDTETVCVQGQCADYKPVPGCVACPCGCPDACCPLQGGGGFMCVSGVNVCP